MLDKVCFLNIKIADRINFTELSFSQVSDLEEEREKSSEVMRNHITFLEWENKNISFDDNTLTGQMGSNTNVCEEVLKNKLDIPGEDQLLVL